jgi:hypothetical protein
MRKMRNISRILIGILEGRVPFDDEDLIQRIQLKRSQEIFVSKQKQGVGSPER